MKPHTSHTSIKRVFWISLITVVVGVLVFVAVSDHILSNAVDRAKALNFLPSAEAQRAKIDSQTEPHTCGLHSINSIYQAYGLNPQDHALRKRIGVDIPAVPTQGDTQGTLQPDITRALAQDGFQVNLLDVNTSSKAAAAALETHLTNQQLALALIRKPDNGNLHWIVLQSAPAGSIELIDSLRTDAHQLPTETFIESQAITVFLLKQTTAPSEQTIKDAHRLGLKTLADTPARIKVLEEK